MDLGSVFLSYATIVGLLAALAAIGSSALSDDLKCSLGTWLSQRVERDPKSWVRSTNRAFFRLFDWIYGGTKGRYPEVEFLFWTGLLHGALALLVVQTILVRIEGSRPSSGVLLLVALGYSVGSALVTAAARWIRNKTSRFADIGVGVVVVYAGLPIAFVLIAIWETFADLGFGGQFDIVMRLLAVGFAIGFAPRVAGFLGRIGGSSATAGPASDLILGRLTLSERLVPVNPLRAAGSAITFLVILSILRRTESTALLEQVRYGQPELLGFLAFNIFADSVSVVETRFVLRRGIEAGLVRLSGLLLLDLLLSTAIFLFLPYSLEELSSFSDGVWFRGDRPWIGILFWTTFSTSLLFYTFFVASLLIRPLSHVPKLGRRLKVETQPIWALAAAMVVVVSLVYLGIAAVLVVQMAA
jgi:hypothetical protein